MVEKVKWKAKKWLRKEQGVRLERGRPKTGVMEKTKKGEDERKWDEKGTEEGGNGLKWKKRCSGEVSFCLFENMKTVFESLRVI